MADRQRKIRNITLWGSFVNILLTAGKISAGVLGKSAAMVADGIHSLSDLMSDIVVLIFTRVASKDKDKDHPFGHGKFETMGTLIVSVLLIIAGGNLLSGGVKSILAFIRGEAIPRPGLIALAAAATGDALTMSLSPPKRFIDDTVLTPSVAAMQTIPTGFSSVAPPGPAIPVTDAAMSEPKALRAPAAISLAVSSDTAPFSISVSCDTPRICSLA